jgi:hypothetical protein
MAIALHTYSIPASITVSQATGGDAGVEGANMVQAGSAQVSVPLAVESLCLILFNGSIGLGAATTTWAVMGYQIGAATPVVVHRHDQANTNAPQNNASFCVPITLPAGTHVVKLMAARNAGNFTIYNATNFNLGQFAVVVLGPA